jgi:hypothetical protein
LRAVQRHRLGAEARELHPHEQVEPAIAHVVAGEQIDQRLEGLFRGGFGAEIDRVDHRTNGLDQLGNVAITPNHASRPGLGLVT